MRATALHDGPVIPAEARDAAAPPPSGGPPTVARLKARRIRVGLFIQFGYPEERWEDIRATRAYREHLARVIDGEIIWAPAIDGAFLLSARGGDFELRLGQDLSIGYLTHDAGTVQLYFQEALTFLVYTAEASVALTAGATA